MRALKREHLGIDEATDVLSFPIDGPRRAAGRACRARSATSCSARRSSATSGAGRSSTGCCTCSATTTATRWRRASALHAHEQPRRRPPSILESFNFAFEGIIHVLRTQRNMRIHFLIAVGVLVAALAFGVASSS